MARYVTTVTSRPARKTLTVNSRSGNDYRGTGRDQMIARNPELMAWLAKVCAEKRHGSRPWPWFDERLLTGFLMEYGVDVDAAMKDHKDAVRELPDSIRDIESCTCALKGASFLTTSVDDVCFKIRRRLETTAR